MPVTKWSTAGTGWQNATLTLTDVVLTAASARNPNVTDRAEATELRVFRGTEVTGDNYLSLKSGWTLGNQHLDWIGHLVLKGDHRLVARVNHASSVIHGVTAESEQIIEALARPVGWKGLWQRWGGSV